MSTNIFKKYIGNKDGLNEHKNNVSRILESNDLETVNNNRYVPPINKVVVVNSNLKQSILKEKYKTKPLYRVTSEKLQSLEVFPELTTSNNNDNDNKEKIWVTKKCEDSDNNKNNYETEDDPNVLNVPDCWLLLSSLNKGKKYSELEKERNERFSNKILEQYYANMRYLMKERNAIKKKLYLTVGEHFGHDSVILRDIPLNLYFLNESDNENDTNTSETEEYNMVDNDEDYYDEDERF